MSRDETCWMLGGYMTVIGVIYLVARFCYPVPGTQGDERMEGSQVVDRQAALSAGRVEIGLTSEGPGRVKLAKVAIHVEEMEKLLGFRQGQLVVCFHNGNGELIAEVHSETWAINIKPKTTVIVLELRIRPEAETLLVLREIQQLIEGKDEEGATVVLRPLQSVQLMPDDEDEEDEEDDDEDEDEE